MTNLWIWIIAYFVAGLMVATGSCNWKEIKKQGAWLIVSYYLVLVPTWPLAAIKAIVHVIMGWYRSGYCAWCGQEFTDHKIESIQAHFLVCEKHPDNKAILEANEDAERLAKELETLLGDYEPIVWEETGETSPALIMHKMRVGK